MNQAASLRPLLLVALLAQAGVPHAGGQEVQAARRPPSAAEVEFFEKEVRPVLAGRCYACHSAGAKRLRGGLRLDTREGVARGGDGGAVVVPGDPESSPLILAVRDDDPLSRMPPDGPLPRREVEALEAWVRMGAPDPRDGPAAGGRRPGAWAAGAEAEAGRWWAFQPVKAPGVPAVRDAAWPRNDVDRFILAALEAKGLAPAPAASRRTLIRRVTFDLIGLPPTPEEVEAFVADEAPDAYERVVERLLASPHHGERWGRHWLDVVRYADTSGCNGDFPAPEAYRYRNYVIDRINRDTPYDRFVREQVAGDLLPWRSDAERFEQVVATGYLAISRRFSSINEEFHLTLDDAIDNLGKAVLGLSVSCARCHDHKFDPIPQADYYALYGILQSTRFAFPGTEIYRHPQDLIPLVSEERLEGELRPWLDRMAGIDAEIARVYPQIAASDTGKEKERLKARWEKLKAERDTLVKEMPRYDKAFGASEGTPTNARVHVKGDPAALGAEVPRGSLRLLGGQAVPSDEPGSGRRQLADWLVDPANPLTARVLVNRVWQHHFGHGLVRTPNDFGTRSQPPTHPELLDHLALRFVESGWSIKALHRRIVLSSTYRMASDDDPRAPGIDPENRLLATFPRRRLDAEELRDAMLAISGGLDRTQGGPHPFPPEWTWRYTQHKPFVDDYPTARRSVYLMQQRFRSQPFLATFDGADTNASTGERTTSATPQQALFALNSAFVQEQAERLADRLAAEAVDPASRIDRAYRSAFGRPPTADEVGEGLEYLQRIAGPLESVGIAGPQRSRAAWVSYLRVVFGSNEFVFVD